MVCFCKDTMSRINLMLPALGAAASLDAAVDVNAQLSLSPDLQALADWLALLGLPAAPWQPDPAWLELRLPELTLSADAVMTLQAFAQLQVLALSLGLDLMVPAQATAFARLAVTLQARLSATLALGVAVNPLAWTQLSSAMTASAQVRAALALGLFPAPPPMGPPLLPWRAFLRQLRALLPVIAIATQLNLNLSVSLAEQLAPMLRAMLRIPMPVMTATLSLMAELTTALSAVAQVRLALGIDPLALGLPVVRLMVIEQLTATEQMVVQATGVKLPNLLALLPQIDFCPSLMATPATVAAAVALNLPPLAWRIPAFETLPVLSVGLPVAAFCAQLQAATGLQASASPCGGGCDAAALMAAA